MSHNYLFSIDLEDIRDEFPDGVNRMKEAVPRCTILFLDWLEKRNEKCTFFIVGDTARRYPELIQEIVRRGHETACHTDKHVHLTNQSEEEFKRDIEGNIKALQQAGAKEIKGFRAPVFSLVPSSEWVYATLQQFGFIYSSSVLPSRNPLYGWNHFPGEGFNQNGIYEIPMNVGLFPFQFPYGGGVYFRLLPTFILKRLFANTFKESKPVMGYFHPYDVDLYQEWFMHPALKYNVLFNYLLYYNRKSVFKKLDALATDDFSIIRYDHYVESKIERMRKGLDQKGIILTENSLA